MLDPKVLELLRCPIDPTREARLELEEDIRLVCSRCRVQFRIKDGFPNLIAEEAVLPDGCPRIEKLPCRDRRSK